MADCVKQVGLAQANITVQKQWIINHPRILAGGDAACMGQSIARADDKTLEGIIRMQTQAFGLIGQLGACLFRPVADI